MLYTKSSQILHRKTVSILIGLKVTSLTSKCVFYTPGFNTEGEPHWIEIWRSWNEINQRIALKA